MTQTGEWGRCRQHLLHSLGLFVSYRMVLLSYPIVLYLLLPTTAFMALWHIHIHIPGININFVVLDCNHYVLFGSVRFDCGVVYYFVNIKRMCRHSLEIWKPLDLSHAFHLFVSVRLWVLIPRIATKEVIYHHNWHNSVLSGSNGPKTYFIGIIKFSHVFIMNWNKLISEHN